jgi:hypothetical protein
MNLYPFCLATTSTPRRARQASLNGDRRRVHHRQAHYQGRGRPAERDRHRELSRKALPE